MQTNDDIKKFEEPLINGKQCVKLQSIHTQKKKIYVYIMYVHCTSEHWVRLGDIGSLFGGN